MSRKQTEQLSPQGVPQEDPEISLEMFVAPQPNNEPKLKLKNESWAARHQRIIQANEEICEVVQNALHSNELETTKLTHSFVQEFHNYDQIDHQVLVERLLLVLTFVVYVAIFAGLSHVCARAIEIILARSRYDLGSIIETIGVGLSTYFAWRRYQNNSEADTLLFYHLNLKKDKLEKQAEKLRKQLLMFVSAEKFVDIIDDVNLDQVLNVVRKFEAEQKSEADWAKRVAQRDAEQAHQEWLLQQADETKAKLRQAKLDEVEATRQKILNSNPVPDTPETKNE